MAKKDTMIYFLRIMSKYSDIDNPLKVKDIMELMKNEYDITLTKQTVYNYIDLLNEMDIEINDAGAGKYMSYRILEKSEVELLIHSIISNNTISKKYSNDLIDKLKSSQSIYFDSNFAKVYNVDKKENKDLFLNIEVINDCIKKNKKVKFTYTKYNMNKEIVPSRERPYTVTPLCIVCHDSRFYFICKYDTQNEYMSFRIDKMINCMESRHEIDNPVYIDPYEYSKHRLYMYGGDIKEFTLRVNKTILDDIIELFGKDIEFYNETKDTFDVNVKTTEKAIKYFAMQYVDYVIVLNPIEIRNEIKEKLEKKLKKYQDSSNI